MKRSDFVPLLALVLVLACWTASISRSTPPASSRPDLLRLQQHYDSKTLTGGTFEGDSSEPGEIWLSGGPPGSCTSDRFR